MQQDGPPPRSTQNDSLTRQSMVQFDDYDGPDNPPEGWRLYRSSSPFTQQIGRMYQHWDKEQKIFRRGFRIRKAHCNTRGKVHGGMLMTFIDSVMGMTLWLSEERQGVTAQMNTEFLSNADPGDWIEAEAHVDRCTKTLAFLKIRVHAGGKLVLTASGLFSLRERKEK